MSLELPRVLGELDGVVDESYHEILVVLEFGRGHEGSLIVFKVGLGFVHARLRLLQGRTHTSLLFLLFLRHLHQLCTFAPQVLQSVAVLFTVADILSELLFTSWGR